MTVVTSILNQSTDMYFKKSPLAYKIVETPNMKREKHQLECQFCKTEN